MALTLHEAGWPIDKVASHLGCIGNNDQSQHAGTQTLLLAQPGP